MFLCVLLFSLKPDGICVLIFSLLKPSSNYGHLLHSIAKHASIILDWQCDFTLIPAQCGIYT